MSGVISGNKEPKRESRRDGLQGKSWYRTPNPEDQINRKPAN